MSSNNNFWSSLPSVGVYSDSDGELIFLLQGQQGGVTHVMFSPDGTRLYSGGRKVHKFVKTYFLPHLYGLGYPREPSP